MSWRSRLADAKRDTYALYLASRDPRVSWPARVFGAVVLAYALSPLDLIPDFIPVVGYLDDAIIIPLGLVLLRKMIPNAVFQEHQAAAAIQLESGAGRWIATATIIFIWAFVAVLVGVALFL